MKRYEPETKSYYPIPHNIWAEMTEQKGGNYILYSDHQQQVSEIVSSMNALIDAFTVGGWFEARDKAIQLMDQYRSQSDA